MPFTTAAVVTRLTAHGEPHDRIIDPRPAVDRSDRRRAQLGDTDEYAPTISDRKVARIAALG